MGLVPRGHGPHDIAASLDIPMNVSEALRIAADGRSAPLDVGLINQKKVNIELYLYACTLSMDITAGNDCRGDVDDPYLC